jgi:hypothetical protein
MTDYGFGPGVGLFESIALINKQKTQATATVEPATVAPPPATVAPPPATEKPKRKAIPKTVREKLWKHTFGDNTFNGSCYCCKTVVDAFHWEAGHINSVHNGGSDKLDNLRVICVSCNRSMGTCNMDEFKGKYFPN